MPATGLIDLRRIARSHRNEAIFLLFALLVSTFLSFLLSGYSRIRIPNYLVGDIAQADVIVPSDIVVMDDQATQARKAAARDKVLPVYRFDPSGEDGLISRVAQYFSACRQILESRMPTGHTVSFRKLPPAVQASVRSETELLGLQTDTELLDFFVRERFAQAIQNQLTSALRQTSELWTVENDRSLVSNAGSIQIAGTSNQRKQTVDVQQVLNLEDARRRLRDYMTADLKASARIQAEASDWLGAFLTANLHFDLEATETRKSEAADAVDPVLRQLKRGKVIVRKGDEISADQLKQIEAVRNRTPSIQSFPQFAGTNLLLLSLLTILGLQVRTLSIWQWSRGKLIALSFVTLTANLALLKVFWFISESLSRNFVANPFNDTKLFFSALPFAFGAMLITLVARERIAQLYLIFYCPLAVQMTGAGFQDFVYIVVISLAGILVVRNAKQRMAIIGAGFKLSAVAVGLFLAVQLAKQAPLDPATGVFGAALAFLSGPITASLLTFTLPLCERLFLVTTEIRLSELGNLNLPLLRELVVRAPGTYNHSVSVGTLAEGAANAIGLSPLFLRVACLYHDIGKMLKPSFYIENQGEAANPHDSLEPRESVRIIKEHISEGIRLSREAGLPPSIIDVIPQHHGTKQLSYFYDKAKEKAGTDLSKIREEDYRYPGPKPQTKEAAIVMLADAIEASARTLPDHSQERLLAVIQKIIAATTEDGQFTECNLTLSEIERITFSFLDTLTSLYHSRIAYPSFDFSPSANLHTVQKR